MATIIKRIARIYRFLFPKSKVLLNDLKRAVPVSHMFGFDRGTPIDRYYIDKFLSGNSQLIKGRVLEIGDCHYSRKYGQEGADFEIMHYDRSNAKATIIGDLADISTLPANYIDCFICTQTYNFIYDVKSAMKGSHYLLKDGGSLLGTVSGISQISRYDMDRWGDFWRFTDRSMKRLLDEAGFKKVEVFPMGNVLSATAFLQGVAVEDIPDSSLLDKNDDDYQLTICFIAIK